MFTEYSSCGSFREAVKLSTPLGSETGKSYVLSSYSIMENQGSMSSFVMTIKNSKFLGLKNNQIESGFFKMLNKILIDEM